MPNFMIYSKNSKKANNILPAGEYPAYITEIFVEENASTSYGNTDITSIKYDVLHNNKIHKIVQRIYFNEYPNSEFQKRISEFMQVLGLEDQIESSDLENKFVNIELSVKESSNGKEYNKVEHILAYTGEISDFDEAKGITPPSTKPLPKSAAADLLFGDDDEDEEGGEA